MSLNDRFVAEVEALGVERDSPVLLLCRSGQRSRAAAIALTAAGFGPCYNVAEGFEGPHDAARHRGTSAGWKARGLPWAQR
jgi:rhodanese-related sulfurtransferase